MFTSIDRFGANIIQRTLSVQQMAVFVYLAFRSAVLLTLEQTKVIVSIIISQVYFTGFQALGIITFIALATGSVIVLQSNIQLSLLGSKDMMGNILVVTIIRELGPLLTALIVIARSGTAVATELGSMQVNREIEALRGMSIEPMSYIVFPRIIGGIISLIALAFYFNFIAIAGGFLSGLLISDLSFSFYIDVLADSLNMSDIGVNLLKNGVSGLIIFSISTYEGMKVSGAPHEVPIASTTAVVNSIIYVVAFNLTASLLMFVRGVL